jgi:hypothetical protein
MRPHQKLEAWGKAIEFVTDVYKVAPFDKESFSVRASGRLTIAQRFIAGTRGSFATKSVKRTTEKDRHGAALFSRPLHGLDFLRFRPSSELLG